MSLEAVFKKIRDGDTSTRDRVFEENTGLVWACVKRYAGLLETEDLFQLGAIGLLRAIDRFDPAYGTAFSTYAFPYIMGEIRRHLRDNTPVKVSRRLKEIASQSQRISRDLVASTGQEPSVTEIASLLGVQPDLVLEALEAARPILYLDELSGYGETGESEPAHRMDLEDALGSLDPSLERVIRGRFFDGKTQQELADEMGISQAHVCRLEKKALQSLRSLLGTSFGV